jgi:hypothetical protein
MRIPFKDAWFLCFQTCADADFRFEQLRDGAPGFGGLYGGVKFGLVRAGNFRDEVKMAFRDGETIPDLFERNRCRRLKLAGRHARAAQLGGKSHRKSTSVRRSEQLLGIGPNAVFKARAVGVLRLLQDAAVRRNRALPIFQTALPNRGCFSLHDFSPFGSFVPSELTEVRFSGLVEGYIQKMSLSSKSCKPE